MHHIAFLRGINVGKAKRVAMADLRAIAEDLGYTNARTLRNSGNLIFETSVAKGKTAAKKMEKELETRLNVSSRIITITEKELNTIIEKDPLVEIAKDHSRYIVAILESSDGLSLLRSTTKENWKPEAIEIGERVAYLWCPDGVLKSALVKAMNGRLGEKVTTRNWATMLKIHEMIHES